VPPSTVPTVRSIILLSCFIGWLVSLFGRLLYGDMILVVQVMLDQQALLESGGCDPIIVSHNVEFFYFESLDVVSMRLVMLLFQIEEMVSLLLDHLVESHGEHLSNQCIVAFIEYHDTPKGLEMAFGIGIPFKQCVADHSQASQRPPLAMLTVPIGYFYDVDTVSQPNLWLNGDFLQRVAENLLFQFGPVNILLQGLHEEGHEVDLLVGIAFNLVAAK
ncbi:unnamed protein product, partial [Prunus brigantina]